MNSSSSIPQETYTHPPQEVKDTEQMIAEHFKTEYTVMELFWGLRNKLLHYDVSSLDVIAALTVAASILRLADALEEIEARRR